MNQDNFEPSFGAHESPADYRTVTTDMLDAVTAISLPNSHTIPLNFYPLTDVYHQRKIGECTQCGAQVAAEEYFKDGVKLSRSWAYLIDCLYIKKAFFEGSSAYNALKTGTNYGYPSMAMEDKYPLKKNGTYDEFIQHFKTAYGGKIPKEILEDALKHKIPGFARVPMNPTDLAKELAEGRVLVSRQAVGSEWWRDEADTFSTWDARYILPLRRPKNVTSGHLIADYGYENLQNGHKLIIKGRNSWSKDWGNNGDYWFYFVDLTGFFTEAWVIRQLPDEVRQKAKDLPAAQDFKHNFAKLIKRGDKGDEVKALQIALCIAGFLDIYADELGSYGPKTARAVYAFQITHKVAPLPELTKLRGETVGPKTRQALNIIYNK